MAGSEKKGKKKPAKRKGGAPKSSFGRVALAVGLVAMIVVAGGFMLVKYLPPVSVTRKHAQVEPPSVKPQPPRYEVFEAHPKPSPSKRPAVKYPVKPRLALIIDDIGYKKRIALELMALDSDITFAVLPKSPFGRYFAQEAARKGVELMLHQPMEPMEYPRVDPGPGALLAKMDPDRLLATLETNLKAFPGIKGINNHMGSRLTSLSPQMYQVMTALKKKGLYFIDSRTTAQTTGRSAARLMQVPFAERDIFLDHIQSTAAVRRQVKKMLDLAEKQGLAIGIGHPHKETLEVLREMMPEIHRRVSLVRPSFRVRVP